MTREAVAPNSAIRRRRTHAKECVDQDANAGLGFVKIAATIIFATNTIDAAPDKALPCIVTVVG